MDLAGAELRTASHSYGTEPAGWLGQSLVVDQAKLLVAQCRPREAIDVIESSPGREQVGSLLALQRAAIEVGQSAPAPLSMEPGSTPLEDQVDGWLVQAARSIKHGDPHRSRLCLERALRLAAPERLRRPFFEAPSAVRKLLQPNGELVARHPWLRLPGSARAVEGTGPGDQAQSPTSRATAATRATPMMNSLTSKEQEVLMYLAELLTTDEIAKTMFVSVNTVRSHVRSILRKLGASRRNEAVRRAWELGLLPTRPAAVPVSPTS